MHKHGNLPKPIPKRYKDLFPRSFVLSSFNQIPKPGQKYGSVGKPLTSTIERGVLQQIAERFTGNLPLLSPFAGPTLPYIPPSKDANDMRQTLAPVLRAKVNRLN